jgi:O-antigen/teichoic acid export membrane protein
MLMVLYAPEILTIWLGPIFAQRGALVMQLAALGVLVGALRTVPVNALNAASRPDVQSKLRLIELPLYVGAAWLLIGWWGIKGAALARLMREALEAISFIVVAHRLLPTIANDRRLQSILLGTAGIGLVLVWPMRLAVRVPLSVMVLTLFAVFGWSWLLKLNERQFIKVRLRLAVADRREL